MRLAEPTAEVRDARVSLVLGSWHKRDARFNADLTPTDNVDATPHQVHLTCSR
jgi:hypothetical protein